MKEHTAAHQQRFQVYQELRTKKLPRSKPTKNYLIQGTAADPLYTSKTPPKYEEVPYFTNTKTYSSHDSSHITQSSSKDGFEDPEQNAFYKAPEPQTLPLVLERHPQIASLIVEVNRKLSDSTIQSFKYQLLLNQRHKLLQPQEVQDVESYLKFRRYFFLICLPFVAHVGISLYRRSFKEVYFIYAAICFFPFTSVGMHNKVKLEEYRNKYFTNLNTNQLVGAIKYFDDRRLILKLRFYNIKVN